MVFNSQRPRDGERRAEPRMGSTSRWFAVVDPERRREVENEAEYRRAMQQQRTSSTDGASPRDGKPAPRA